MQSTKVSFELRVKTPGSNSKGARRFSTASITNVDTFLLSKLDILNGSLSLYCPNKHHTIILPQAWRSSVRFPMRSKIFPICLILSATLWCQEWVPGIFLGVNGARRVRLTISRPSMNRVSRKFHNSMGLYRPSLWSSGQSSWLQIQRSGVIFWEAVGPERDPLSPVSTTEELLEIKSSSSGLENRDYGRRDSSRWQRGTLYPQKLALSSSTRGSRSVGIVR
jgi:hypothetical protein